MSIRITCIKKGSGFHSNPYTAIESLGWVEDVTGKTGSSTRIEVYDWLKKGNWAYVRASDGVTAYLITAETDTGTKYVKTVPDETTRDNLLHLPECKN